MTEIFLVTVPGTVSVTSLSGKGNDQDKIIQAAPFLRALTEGKSMG